MYWAPRIRDNGEFRRYPVIISIAGSALKCNCRYIHYKADLAILTITGYFRDSPLSPILCVQYTSPELIYLLASSGGKKSQTNKFDQVFRLSLFGLNDQ